MTALSKERLLSADSYRREKVDLPELGGFVYVGAVSAADWMDCQDAALKDKDEGGRGSTAPWVGRMLVKSIVDEDGNRLFGDEDAEELMRRPLAVINRLYKAADAVNDFAGRGVKDAEKNSVREAGEDSPTPSLVN